MTTEFINKFDNIDKEISSINKSLAKCRREACEKDHDTIIEIETEQTHMKEKIHTQTEILDKTVVQTLQLSGNLNQITEKIAEMVKHDSTKKTFLYTVIGGVLITLISAAIIYFTSMTVGQLLKSNQIDMLKLQQTIEEVQKEVKDVQKNTHVKKSIGNSNP